jgi:hypothetical protein
LVQFVARGRGVGQADTVLEEAIGSFITTTLAMARHCGNRAIRGAGCAIAGGDRFRRSSRIRTSMQPTERLKTPSMDS